MLVELIKKVKRDGGENELLLNEKILICEMCLVPCRINPATGVFSLMEFWISTKGNYITWQAVTCNKELRDFLNIK